MDKKLEALNKYALEHRATLAVMNALVSAKAYSGILDTVVRAGSLDEADREKERAKREAEMEQMVRDVSVFLPSSMCYGDIRLVCAAALDACYRKFEIVEDDV